MYDCNIFFSWSTCASFGDLCTSKMHTTYKICKTAEFFNMSLHIHVHVQGTYWISEFSAGDPLEHHEVGFDRTSGKQK